MKRNKIFLVVLILLVVPIGTVCGQNTGKTNKHNISFTITKRYLNLPVSQDVDRGKMSFKTEGKADLNIVIRLSSHPAYWVFYDLSRDKGKVLKISYEGDPGGLSRIYQDDVIAGQDSLYKERNRPQIHFTTRRGWINDPNGLLYYEGEYHLFYQHNPFEREWENMSWGHAVSRDLIHWKELPVVMYPDRLGAIYSGSAVVDYNNTSGFGKNGLPAMVAIYTVANSTNQRQCIAYSLDKGRTFTKYKGISLVVILRSNKRVCSFWVIGMPLLHKFTENRL